MNPEGQVQLGCPAWQSRKIAPEPQGLEEHPSVPQDTYGSPVNPKNEDIFYFHI